MIKVVYNPVVTEQILSLAQTKISYPWFSGVTRSVIVAADRLTQQKDFATLILAFALVQEKLGACP